MVAMLVQAGEALVVPEGMQIMIITRDTFENMLLKEAGCSYNNDRLVNR